MDADMKPKGSGWEKQVPPPREGPRIAGREGEPTSREAATARNETVRVVVTIDTEPDNVWENHASPSVTNVRELPRLQSLLAKSGAQGTYLVTSRVIQDPAAVEVLRHLVDTGGGEIGAHLHPWESPPFTESGVDITYPIFPHELSPEIFGRKLAGLTGAIAQCFSPPTSYRGGRWSIAPEHISVLEQAGFEVDTTVTPLIDWHKTMGIPVEHKGRGGMDYRLAPRHPYHPDYADVTRKGSARILEIPVTVAFTHRMPSFIRCKYGAMPTVVQRVLRRFGLLKPVWAMPAQETEEDLAQMLSVATREEVTVINIALHSSELMVGGAPWSRTEAEAEGALSRLASMLGVLASSGVCVFTTLTDAARWWKARQALMSTGTQKGPGVR